MRGSLRFVAGSVVVLAVVFTAGTDSLASTSSVIVAKRQHQAPYPMAGITTCPLEVKMQFSSPLDATPASAEVTVTFAASALVACSNRFQGNVRLVRGQLSSLTGTIASGTTCIEFLSGLSAPDLAGGSVKWTPSSKIDSSTALAFPAGSLTASATNLRLGYSSGTVSGSYATTSARVVATSDADIATLTNLCNSDLYYIGFTGSITL